MRQVVLDTETTGLDPEQGHRIIEIGCVEIINRRLSNNRYHQYLQPDREIEAGAQEVHGITNEFLADKPRFGDIAADFIAFVEDAELIIHNAPFDVGFINSELRLLGQEHSLLESRCKITDTLSLARKMHPGQKNSLDALCKRYEIDNSQRTLHGALLDAEILADVYLAMTGGQVALVLEADPSQTNTVKNDNTQLNINADNLLVQKASADELAEHNAYLEHIRKTAGECVWDEIES